MMDSRMEVKYKVKIISILSILVISVLNCACIAVTTKVTRHSSSTDLLKGEVEDVVIGSRGTIQLGRSAEVIIDKFEGFSDVWSINSIVLSGGTLYFGTSPNGGIYRYSLGTLTRIYPQQEGRSTQESSLINLYETETEDDSDSEDSDDAVTEDEHLSNEHIFAMATDVSGRLLAGISGDNCRLCRFESNSIETIFEPEEAKYIFAIALDDSGNIYLGTGPQGRIYRLDPMGTTSLLIYESRDKNILSLATGQDGYIYAGSDSRGIVYKIEPHGKQTTVLYDSDQPEIAALLYTSDSRVNRTLDPNTEGSSNANQVLYAAATLAQIVQTQTQFASSVTETPSSGRPETPEDGDQSNSVNEGGRKLEIANTQEPTDSTPDQPTPPVRRGARTTQASHVYRINNEGYVTDIFEEAAVLFCIAQQSGNLLLGTGNKAQVFRIEPALEQKTVIYEDQQAAQITAIAADDDELYLGTANPAKIIKLKSGFANEGTYVSDLVDAGQPAKWGKLQIEADIPRGCRVLVASRSGNVQDVNDPTFSQWTEPMEVTQPVQLQCPLGRFCQYKLILQSENGYASPLIREVAVAGTVPNLAPKVDSVNVGRVDASNKQGVFRINFSADDDNSDQLMYKIDFRKIGRTNWINLKDEHDATNFEWDGKTVEDGRYEVRVTASDHRSNSASTKLTGSRVSDPVVVDNTAPVTEITKTDTNTQNDKSYRVFTIVVTDELSAIGKLEYTIDSNDAWTGTVPDDLVYDTTSEFFTITIDEEEYLPKGEHVLSIRVADAVGNITYKTLDINVD